MILAGFAVDVVMVASLMATARIVSPGTTLSMGILQKKQTDITHLCEKEFNRRNFSCLLYNTSADFSDSRDGRRRTSRRADRCPEGGGRGCSSGSLGVCIRLDLPCTLFQGNKTLILGLEYFHSAAAL